jgi:hypothetical protein
MVDSIIMAMEQKSDFKEELEHLQGHLPDWAAGVMRKTMEPSAKWIRMPVGIALMTGGTLGFLPILGFWMLPFGLALIARDVPFMQPPLARGFAWINRKLGYSRDRQSMGSSNDSKGRQRRHRP